ncbi:MAG: GumC family protein, partial [Alphaproteobacteria bacterium]|nr:GumC family protein [Alphaproteobacteria bacterium]
SSASVLVEPRDSVFSRAANDSGNRTSAIADGVLMSSQVELIQSDDLLLRVVRSEKLVDVAEFNGSAKSLFDPLFAALGRSKTVRDVERRALGYLSGAVTVIQQRDSRIISILVRTRDRDLSARIANAIAVAHVNRRAELSIDDTADASKWLETEIGKLRVSVVAAQAAVAAFRIDNDLFSGPNNTSLLEQQLSNIATQITTAQERRNTAISRATLIRSMIDAGQPIDGVADVRSSAVIQRLSEQMGRLQGERAQLLATLLPNHPRVQALSAQISETSKQIMLEGRQVADALEAEAQIEQTLIASLKDDLTRAKLEASSATTASVRLEELQREAEAQNALLQTYLIRYRDASARTDAGAVLPDVRVIGVARPALSPVSPKTSLILVAVIMVSLAVQVGSIVFAGLGVPISLAPVQREQRPQAQTGEEQQDQGEQRGLAAEAAQAAEPELSGLADEPETPDLVDDASHDDPLIYADDQSTNTSGAATDAETDVSSLLSSLSAGEESLVLIAALDRDADCASVGRLVVDDVMHKGFRVAVVDASSANISRKRGISDLSADLVDFGEVIFSSEEGDLIEVYWGTRPAINESSDKPLTLIKALGDICEIVVVFAGNADAAAGLALFSGVEGAVVLVAGAPLDAGARRSAINQAAALGFERSRVVVAGAQKSKIA